jgi:hypothetical protein
MPDRTKNEAIIFGATLATPRHLWAMTGNAAAGPHSVVNGYEAKTAQSQLAAQLKSTTADPLSSAQSRRIQNLSNTPLLLFLGL